MKNLKIHIPFFSTLLIVLILQSGSFAQNKIDNSIDFLALSSAIVENLENINTKNIEFSPSFYKNGLVFVFSEKRKGGHYDKNINTSFFDLKYADLSNTFAKPLEFSEELNDRYHMSPVSFYDDDTKMLLALNNTKEKGPDGFYQMDLIIAEQDSAGLWSLGDKFIYDKDNYTIFHPTLNKENKILVFASNMPGGFGKMDLYFCLKVGQVWGAPINMGPYINTEGNDWFPRFYEDRLFFASDSRQGYGGYDIYVSANKNGVFQFPDNIGEPINSEGDDFGLIFSDDGMTGFFTSDRKGGKGADDIYKVELQSSVIYKKEKEPKQREFYDMTIHVIDKMRNTGIASANIQLLPIDLDKDNLNSPDYKINVLSQNKVTGEITIKLTPKMLQSGSLIEKLTDYQGELKVQLERGKNYVIIVSKNGFIESQDLILDLSTNNEIQILLDKRVIVEAPKSKPIVVHRPQSPPETKTFIPLEKGEKVVFENIYFDVNSANIKAGAAAELDALALAMIDAPSIKIKLSAFTDVRGNAAYNKALSQERASSAKNYLTKKGVESNRIKTYGYGEEQIRNRCKAGVKCSKKEHAYNRRIEVTIR